MPHRRPQRGRLIPQKRPPANGFLTKTLETNNRLPNIQTQQCLPRRLHVTHPANGRRIQHEQQSPRKTSPSPRRKSKSSLPRPIRLPKKSYRNQRLPQQSPPHGRNAPKTPIRSDRNERRQRMLRQNQPHLRNLSPNELQSFSSTSTTPLRNIPDDRPPYKNRIRQIRQSLWQQRQTGTPSRYRTRKRPRPNSVGPPIFHSNKEYEETRPRCKIKERPHTISCQHSLLCLCR